MPCEYAKGVALGVCIFFISSSGYAKLLVGGTEWAKSCTLDSVLEQYQKYNVPQGGPGLPALTRFARSQPWILSALASGTLLFECVLVPSSLFLPPALRVYMVYGSLGLHLGIAVMQSWLIGSQ
jgi:hypothetical protein